MNCKFWWFLLPQDIIEVFTQVDDSRITEFADFNALVADITWWKLPQKLQLMADFVEYNHTFTWFRLPEQVEEFCSFVSQLVTVPPLTVAYVELGDGCPPNIPLTTAIYHNGAGALPTDGDLVYTDSEGTTALADGFYELTTTSGNTQEAFGQITSGVYATASPSCE